MATVFRSIEHLSLSAGGGHSAALPNTRRLAINPARTVGIALQYND